MNRRQVGADYEQAACDYLVSCGFRIVVRNYRCRTGEIDIVAREEVCMPYGEPTDYLVFTEVKYRADESRAGGPLAAVNRRKQQRIFRTAVHYLLENGMPETTPVRFDVVGITPGGIQLVRDAFHISSSAGRRRIR